ncbi:putative disulfide isomerase [Aspergillus japonicus CBS 114.51]|uniref:protein disulfide-isomerase n=2 Tax=Aspergillus TaxID=5052 RepID=A0A2V5HUK9_ASPV1|nr:putative disulfide isomerase [Aspergillus japonicus CBS 114.51]PYI15587.1 putative disulfide isomerase [Aspergillus violaceofuscus CBS 115571]RAH75968.1 putative disulfide isomerase [Aspergillus japonicus CBS 114.51]
MVRLSHLASYLTLAAATASAAVVDLVPQNFDAIVLQSGKPALVEFFAPWCGHCKNLAPTYEELSQAFAHATDKVTVAKVDADEHRDLGRRFGVQGFPTLKWFDGKSDVPEDYKGGRDLESLSAFIAEKTGVRPRGGGAAAAKEPSAVVMLTDESFAKVVGGEKDVLVAFTAPWCGHCKSLAPTWETLAHDFAREANVVIAKVDAEGENSKATAKANGVTGYPTIKFFPRGSTEATVYNGARSEQAFIDFLNEHAGTHRAVGGGLNAQAGTVAALNELIVAGGPALKDEIKKAAEGLTDQYAPYYVKVADKLSQNAGYVTKELARLEKILAKGGSAPEKLDDLVSRSNILRQFVLDDAPEEKDEL